LISVELPRLKSNHKIAPAIMAGEALRARGVVPSPPASLQLDDLIIAQRIDQFRIRLPCIPFVGVSMPLKAVELQELCFHALRFQ
jgi:hypothetical protein